MRHSYCHCAIRAAVLIAFIAGGCLAQACAQIPRAGRSAGSHLIIGVGRDFFDGPDSRTFLHGSTSTWEALTQLDDTLNAQPWLAESWEARDGAREWRFHLREAVRFHDGSLVTAQDVVASLDRIRTHPKYDPNAVYRHVASIGAEDDRTVVIRLGRPVPALPNLLAYYSSPILKPSTFRADGHLEGFIATGPYRLEQVRRGESIDLVRFERYWGPPAAYDTVRFRMIGDPRTRVAALIAGDLDVIADVGAILPSQVDELRHTPHIVVRFREVATTHYLFFNCRRRPFAGSAERRWLAAILDRPRMVAAIGGEAAAVARDPFSRLAQRWASGVFADPPAPPDPPAPAAVRLIVSAATVGRWPYAQIAQHVEDRLRRHGWTATIAILEAGAFQQALSALDFDLALQPHTLMTGDPDFFYSHYLAADGPRACGCASPAVERLIAEARDETDTERRRDGYRRLAELIASEVPVLPLYHDISIFAHRDHVVGFDLDAQFRPRLTREARKPE